MNGESSTCSACTLNKLSLSTEKDHVSRKQHSEEAAMMMKLTAGGWMDELKMSYLGGLASSS